MSNGDLSRFGSCPSLQKEDILFPRCSNVEQQDYMKLGLEDWFYSSGFRRAAHLLARQMSDTGTENHFVIYPLIYLYRHYFELILKAIIASAHRLLSKEPTKQDLKTLADHDLQQLWQVAQPLLNPVCECAGATAFPASELEGVTSYILQIHEHDPDGQRFRYGTKKPKANTQTCPSLSPDLDLKNVRALATTLEKLADYLEGIEWWFVELEDVKVEFERLKENKLQ